MSSGCSAFFVWAEKDAGGVGFAIKMTSKSRETRLKASGQVRLLQGTLCLELNANISTLTCWFIYSCMCLVGVMFTIFNILADLLCMLISIKHNAVEASQLFIFHVCRHKQQHEEVETSRDHRNQWDSSFQEHEYCTRFNINPFSS